MAYFIALPLAALSLCEAVYAAFESLPPEGPFGRLGGRTAMDIPECCQRCRNNSFDEMGSISGYTLYACVASLRVPAIHKPKYEVVFEVRYCSS
jgi:hypothetical protein